MGDPHFRNPPYASICQVKTWRSRVPTHRLQMFHFIVPIIYTKFNLLQSKRKPSLSAGPIFGEIVEGNLEVKLPTIWAVGKAEVGRVREEKKKREKIREETTTTSTTTTTTTTTITATTTTTTTTTAQQLHNNYRYNYNFTTTTTTTTTTLQLHHTTLH